MSRFFNWDAGSVVSPLGQAIDDYLDKNPNLATRLDGVGASVAPAGLPPEYDNVPYRTTVNGQPIETVGEYKAAVQKSTDFY